MKIYYAVLATILTASVIVFGVVFLKDLRDSKKSLQEMADSEKKQTSGDTFTFPEKPKSEDEESGNGTRIDENSFTLELSPIRSNQLDRLLSLGFHQAAGLSAEEFSLLVPVPESSNAVLVVNESLVDLPTQCRLLGVQNLLDPALHFNLTDTPDAKVYWRYDLDDGRSRLGKSASESRELLKNEKRRPATTAEVLAIYCQNPDVLKHFFLDAAGSGYSDGRNPHLSLNEGQAELRAALSNRGHRMWTTPSFRRN